jgi:hypothetical protein
MSNDHETRDLRPYMLNSSAFDVPPAAEIPPAAANNRPPGGPHVRRVHQLQGPHNSNTIRGIVSPPAEADSRSARLQRRRNRDRVRRLGGDGGLIAQWTSAGRPRGSRQSVDARNTDDDTSELLSPLFQPPNPPSNRRQRPWGDYWEPTPTFQHSGMRTSSCPPC